MLKSIKIGAFLLVCTTLGFFYGSIPRQNIFACMPLRTKNASSCTIVNMTLSAPSNPSNISTFKSPSEVLKEGDGIIFLETTDRMQLPPLVLCAVESAARVYKDRPVAFFLKGVKYTDTEELVRTLFPTLSTLSNIYFFPLKFEEVFAETPLHAWYMKINPQQESFWTHVSSDGCRLALVWKYGGIYLDTDVISIRTIPKQNFLAAESYQFSSNGVFGFSSHHNFTQKCLKDYVQNYNSRLWGNQGPRLFTRVIRRMYDVPKFKEKEDMICGDITIYKPDRFYPVPGSGWKRFYQVWDKLPTFNDSYGLHFWNSVNHDGKLTMVPGSNMLAEHLYKEFCPSTYEDIRRTTSHW